MRLGGNPWSGNHSLSSFQATLGPNPAGEACWSQVQVQRASLLMRIEELDPCRKGESSEEKQATMPFHDSAEPSTGPDTQKALDTDFWMNDEMSELPIYRIAGL